MKGSDGIDTQNNGNLKDGCKSLDKKYHGFMGTHNSSISYIWSGYNLITRVTALQKKYSRR